MRDIDLELKERIAKMEYQVRYGLNDTVIRGSELRRTLRGWTKPEIELVTKIIDDITNSNVIVEHEKGKVEVSHIEMFNILSARIKNFYENDKLKDVFVMIAPPYKSNHSSRHSLMFEFTLLGYSEMDDKGNRTVYEFVKLELEDALPKPIVDAFKRLWEQLDENKYEILMKTKERDNIFGIDASELK